MATLPHPAPPTRKLQDAITLDDLAALIGTSPKILGYFLYKKRLDQQYLQFKIPKKSGGERIISAPTKNLKIIQRSLAKELNKLRAFKPSVKGFVAGESIKTNAQAHVQQKFVLNIDLDSFFETINFGRVYGMLTKKPYGITPNIAAAIAKAATIKNALATGAPSSPVLSNLICTRLDSTLSRLAKEHHCVYTRYADDITFSTHRNKFTLARRDEDGSGVSSITLSPAVIEAIESNGFKINSAKTRLYTQRDRQEVTGLIVNKRVNVKRIYVRNTRAMLHAWRKHGLELAQEEFQKRSHSENSFTQCLQGRISFIAQIRGKSDSVFKKFSNDYNLLAQKSGIKSRISTQLTPYEICMQSTWVIEGDGNTQGTAVFVQGHGLVTCAHCLSDNPYIYHKDYPAKKFKVSVQTLDKHRDLAILTCEIKMEGIPIRPSAPQQHEPIYLVGYPNHAAGRPLRNERGQLISSFPRSGVTMIEVSAKIIEGNSGGPVLDEGYRLLGIAKSGINSKTPVSQAEFLAISAHEIVNLVRSPEPAI